MVIKYIYYFDYRKTFENAVTYREFIIVRIMNMNSISKRLLSAVLSSVIYLSVFACGKEDGSTDAQGIYGGEAVVGITQEPMIFDPFTVEAAGDKEILFNVYEGLMKFDHEGHLNPCLATDYTISDDATQYTFTLREGVLFHDGSELDAGDVIYSLTRASELNPELSAISSVTDNGDNTVTVTLDAPNSEFLSYFTSAIIPEGSGETIGDTRIGTGPFVFESYEPGIGIVLTRNENYWNPELPYLDKVTFKVCADMDAGLIELNGGSIDIFPYLTADKAAQLDPSQFNIQTLGSNMIQGLFLNNAVAPFDDVRVRQAVNYAINRTDIIDLIMNGQGLELTTAMSPVMGDAYDTALDGTYSQDIDRALELLADAGSADGFDMTITVPSNYLIHVNTAVAIADQLSQVGINVSIEQVDWATWLDRVYAGRDYQSTIIALTSDYAPFDVINRYHSAADNNFINYSNPDVDRLIEQIPLTPGEDERIGMYRELLGYMTEDAASCYIQDPYSMCAVASRLEGYELYPMYVQDMSTVHLVSADS